MKKILNKIDWKIFNISLWIELLLAYILPYKNVDDFEFQVGFPLNFLSVYNSKLGTSPLNSMYVNPFIFLINCFIIYFVLIFLTKKSKL